MPVLQEGPLCAAGAHDQADSDAGDHARQVGASGRGEVRGRAVRSGRASTEGRCSPESRDQSAAIFAASDLRAKYCDSKSAVFDGGLPLATSLASSAAFLAFAAAGHDRILDIYGGAKPLKTLALPSGIEPLSPP